MFPTRLDTTMLDSLMEMGGEELRLQLLADLQDCEAGLKALCLSDPGSVTGTAQSAAHVLHTLRGLAMTIGAATLARACMQAEELGGAAGREMLVQNMLNVVQESVQVRAQIEQCPDRDQ